MRQRDSSCGEGSGAIPKVGLPDSRAQIASDARKPASTSESSEEIRMRLRGLISFSMALDDSSRVRLAPFLRKWLRTEGARRSAKEREGALEVRR